MSVAVKIQAVALSREMAMEAKLTGRKTPITADKLRRLRELIVASRAQTEQDRKVDGEVMRREYGGGIDGS